ncbi:hypothetical protein [Treponema sp. R80B11-R83G3]
MVNKRFWLGILVIVLVFGMTVIGCDEEDTSTSDFDGVWISDDAIAAFANEFIKINANNGSFTASSASTKTAAAWDDKVKGTYPKNAKSSVEFTITQVNTNIFSSTNEWKNWAALDTAQKQYFGGSQKITITLSNNQFTLFNTTFTRQ